MAVRAKEALGQKPQQDLYLEQECRKCGNNRGARAGAFKAPEVTKGPLALRAQVEVGGGRCDGRRGLPSEEAKKTGP